MLAMAATLPESFKDLLAAPGVAILTTQGQDGFPQTSALWFLLDDDGKIKVSLNSSRQKTINLLRDPHVSFFFVDPANPYHTLEIRGLAEAEPDPDYVFADKVGQHYGGANLRDNDRPGETRYVVTINPVKVHTFGH
jgi:PPOX class probable F420-dependent enzyme